MYLAVFIDLYSRMVVGWSLGTRLDASLVTTAFRNAVARRRPKPGLIVHTDQGVQYTSESFLVALNAVQARQSMSRRGNCWDNAPAESFFHSLKVEAVYGEDIETRKEMEYEVFDYIERFYSIRPLPRRYARDIISVRRLPSRNEGDEMTTEAERRKHISEQARSGESIEAYCQRVGISSSTFTYWKSQLKRSGEARFVSVGGTDEAELHLPSGIIIKTRISNLSKVLEAIDARAHA